LHRHPFSVFSSMRRRPPTSPLSPYTTLFRSCDPRHATGGDQQAIRAEACAVIELDGVRLRSATGGLRCAADAELDAGRGEHRGRSEEHTSELQSRGHLVCRLLLEKKKTRVEC